MQRQPHSLLSIIKDGAAKAVRSGVMQALAGLVFLFLSGCSSSKYLKPGETVLSKVELKAEHSSFKTGDLRPYLRQHANTKWFSLVKVPLGVYCMSTADSARSRRRFQRMLRNIGEAPTVYDTTLTAASVTALEGALFSRGYLRAKVTTETRRVRHKTELTYRLSPGPRYYVRSLNRSFDNDTVRRLVTADSAASLLRRGMPLDLNRFSEERTRVVRYLRERGYYYLNNEFLSYDIDTVPGSLATDVTIRLAIPPEADSLQAYTPQRYRRVRIVEEPTEAVLTEQAVPLDSTYYRGVHFVYYGRPKLNKRLYLTQIGLRPDSLYRESEAGRTYGSLNALPNVHYTTVKLSPADSTAKPGLLDCDISVRHNKPHSIGLEVEGTNTAGDLGAAVALSYTNRNLFHGSEMLGLKLRGAYEAITGLEGYANQNYIEWSAEASLRFPNLLLPFISLQKKRELKAFSELKVMYNMQDRPEFHRRVLTSAWNYRWNNAANPRWQHFFELLSINYVYMPWISETFRNDYLEGEDPHYSVLRYSYENLFITKTGYNFVYNSLRETGRMATDLYQTNGFQIKFGVELAGNVLYGISKAMHADRGKTGSYDLFGIAYSQYAKFDFDFAKSLVVTDKNSVAFHIGLGFGLPYGNSTILPYEKRYFSGGANSVRGWSVRGLGPGSYRGKDGKVDFVNQTGNLKLDLSVEWRTHLFWKIHTALFIDAGNVWNTRRYDGMEGALFRFSDFYRQIAVAYGLGVRFNFDYFILRLDGGMKAIDPAVPSGRLHYPISRPDFKRDFTLHFAVGLPF